MNSPLEVAEKGSQARLLVVNHRFRTLPIREWSASLFGNLQASPSFLGPFRARRASKR